ncbi:integral membrane protein, partial [Tubulinosema ratisbonensis]
MVEFVKKVCFSFCLLGCFQIGVPKELIESTKNIRFGKLRHLTTLGLYMTILTTLLGFFINDDQTFLGKIYLNMLATTLPLEMAISLLFWVIYYLNPPALFNSELYNNNIRTTLFGSSCTHLFPLLLLLLQIRKKNLRRSLVHYYLLGMVGILYFVQVHLFFYFNKSFPYPFLNKLGFNQRIILFFVCFCMIIV